MVSAISGMGQPATAFTVLFAHPTQAFAKIKQFAIILILTGNYLAMARKKTIPEQQSRVREAVTLGV
jgi:hypothetical protein